MLIRDWNIKPSFTPLLLGTIIIQICLIIFPIVFLSERFWFIPLSVIGLCLLVFSVERTLLLMLLITIVIPASILSDFIFPGGFRLQEVMLLIALLFGLIDLIFLRQFEVRRTGIDVAMLCFLLVVILSIGVGYIHGNAPTVIWRDVRFPLYYVVFFLVTQFLNREIILQRIVPLIIFSGIVVALEYVLEFVGAIDLSIGERFVRVARLQGMILPLALLLIVSELTFSTKRWSKSVLVFVFIPVGLAFVLTVGRSMWAAFTIGLISIGLMHFRISRVRRWRSILLVGSVIVFLVAIVMSFQRFTGASIGAQIFERSRTLIQFEDNVHVLGRIFSYGEAWEEISNHPIIGHGQGKTLMLLNYSEELRRFEWVKAWTVDSLYLSILLKMGFLGLIVFLWMYGCTLLTAWRTFKSADDPRIRSFCSAAFSTLVGLSVLGIGNASLINGRFALVYAFIFGCVAVISRQAKVTEGTNSI